METLLYKMTEMIKYLEDWDGHSKDDVVECNDEFAADVVNEGHAKYDNFDYMNDYNESNDEPKDDYNDMSDYQENMNNGKKEKVINATSILKKEALRQAVEKDRGTKFERNIQMFTNKIDLANKFIKIQPVYYERKKQFYIWDFNKFCWVLKDETDILNLISKNSYADTISSNEKTEILEALKQVGRLNKPKDIKPNWVQYKDIIYDIETNENFKATPEYFVSNPIDWKVGKSEEIPTIDKLIKSWVSKEDVPKIYEVFAFTTVPKYFIHAFHYYYSEPGKGKSTALNLLIKFLGEHNCTATSIDRINNNPRFETINWHKKLLITLSEVSNINDLRNSGLINQATGEDLIKGEVKGGDTFDFVNYGKFIYPTNKLLKVSSNDGFGRRTRVINFQTRFEKEKDVISEIPDVEFENLAKKCLRIAGELWINRKFTGDTSISDRMKHYQEISKTKLEHFLNKECDFSDFEAKMLFDEFYSKYIKTLENVESKINVSKQLKKLGYSIKIDNYQKDGNWTSGSNVFGIKWKEYQSDLVSKS
jgi:phage/plasmid-associated DNA primase